MNAKMLIKNDFIFELYPWEAQKNTENDEINVPFIKFNSLLNAKLVN